MFDARERGVATFLSQIGRPGDYVHTENLRDLREREESYRTSTRLYTPSPETMRSQGYTYLGRLDAEITKTKNADGFICEFRRDDGLPLGVSSDRLVMRLDESTSHSLNKRPADDAVSAWNQL